MKTWLKRAGLIAAIGMLIACQAAPINSSPDEGVLTIPPTPALSANATAQPAVTPSSVTTAQGEVALYQDAAQPVAARVDDLLARMTLAEKIGQMTQVERNSLQPGDVATYFIGSVLSGGDSLGDDAAQNWRGLVDGFLQGALNTRLAIPLIFGLDAVHGNAHLSDAVFFPHNIGLGATRDAELVEKIGRATAEEMAAIDVRWNFAPVIAVPQDTRWGRTYEGYSENTALVTDLGVAYIRGLQSATLTDATSVIASAKHFVGDGGTAFGSSKQNIMNVPYLLDQGDMVVDEATLRELFLPPYAAAIQAGARNVMVSFSSWRGLKLHMHQHLLTEVLKGELGFTGFVVTDWGGMDQLPGAYSAQVAAGINAGIDMVMVPYEYQKFIKTLTQLVENGQVPPARIDDAVRRILAVKFEMGLFEQPLTDTALLAQVGSPDHRALARQAVRESLVLLKNDQQALPIAKDTPLIFVAGQAAEDIGLQSGGWSIEWQGKEGKIAAGTTILDGIKQTVSARAQVVYDRFGKFSGRAEVGIVVVAEKPYAEGVGDSADPKLAAKDIALIENVRAHANRVIVIMMSGRPIEITEQLPLADAWIAAWLPGTEGNGVSDMLFGDYEFTGKLPYTWQRWNKQLPFNFKALPKAGCDAPLFAYGYGLKTTDTSPSIPECPKP